MKSVQAMQGMKYFIKVLDFIEDNENHVTWIAFEMGKRTLSERLFQLKVEQKDEYAYSIKHQIVYNLLLHGKGILVNLITYVCQALQVL